MLPLLIFHHLHVAPVCYSCSFFTTSTLLLLIFHLLHIAPVCYPCSFFTTSILPQYVTPAHFSPPPIYPCSFFTTSRLPLLNFHHLHAAPAHFSPSPGCFCSFFTTSRLLLLIPPTPPCYPCPSMLPLLIFLVTKSLYSLCTKKPCVTNCRPKKNKKCLTIYVKKSDCYNVKLWMKMCK